MRAEPASLEELLDNKIEIIHQSRTGQKTQGFQEQYLLLEGIIVTEF